MRMDLRRPSCSSSGVGAGVDRHHRQGSPPVKGIHRGRECDAIQPTGLRVMWRWSSHGLEGGPLCGDVRLRGGGRGVDPALGATRPIDDVGLGGGDQVARWIWGLVAECAAKRWRGSARWIWGRRSPTGLLCAESATCSTWIR
jgi:hypothetical protein